MTAIAFHVNAPDKVAYTCRLLRKAVSAGSKVLVTGEREQLADLDVALWTFSALDFVPHCSADAAESVARRSPIVLATAGRDVAPVATVQVHLGGPMNNSLESLERVIEVIGQGEAERIEARNRWKQYATMGHALSHHDVSALRPQHG
jgi:DNA polymerase-3 subunit chi